MSDLNLDMVQTGRACSRLLTLAVGLITSLDQQGRVKIETIVAVESHAEELYERLQATYMLPYTSAQEPILADQIIMRGLYDERRDIGAVLMHMPTTLK